MRKICFGTTSDKGKNFAPGVISYRDLQKRSLSAIEVISTIATAVITGQAYPDVFNSLSLVKPGLVNCYSTFRAENMSFRPISRQKR